MGVRMKLGFITHITDTHNVKTTGVWGEDLVTSALCKALCQKDITAEVKSIKDLSKNDKYDIAIHTADLLAGVTLKAMAKHNFLWIQGFSYDRQEQVIDLDKVYKDAITKYDKVITASRILSDRYKIPFLPPSVDMSYYKKVDANYEFDVSFIGNLIKPTSIVQRYISPFANFKYGLFGGDFGKVDHQRGLEIICGSKINLHFGFEESIKWDMVTGRPFHISACEGFTLMDEVPYFMELYKDAIGFTGGGTDEIRQINQYLQDDKERLKMAKDAYTITRENFSSPVIADKFIQEVM